MNTCPCNDCLMIPACRHKRWSKMVNDCSLMRSYDTRFRGLGPIFYYRQVIQEILKPTEWLVDENGYFTEGWWHHESTL